MCYIGSFIMKTIKESINPKEFKKLMIYTKSNLKNKELYLDTFDIRGDVSLSLIIVYGSL